MSGYRFGAWRSGFCALACVSGSHFAKPVLAAAAVNLVET